MFDKNKIYKKGYIYAIIGLETGKMYIGCTIRTINDRMKEHKSEKNNCTSKSIIDDGNYEVIILEEYENITINELYQHEKNNQIKNIDYIINKIIIGRVKDHLLVVKEYYEKNKENILEKSKIYYEKNKERISIIHKEEFKCDCGSIVTKTNKSRHLKSKKHKNYILSQEKNK